jgi:phage gp45-like
MRSNTRDVGTGLSLAASRATLTRADDSKKKQEFEGQALYAETHSGIERFQNYGHSSVPLPPTPNSKEAAEAVILYLGAHRSHPVVVVIDDRRYRPTGWQPGESGLYDDQKQKVHVQRNGVRAAAAAHSIAISDGIAKHRAQANGFIINEVGDLSKLKILDKSTNTWYQISPSALTVSTPPPDDPTTA